ncbi:SGNH/GDSL hydrolase family protein [Neobacillus jeddahensis]|uniref:SGNH/GDSL hydrolase family protein n=1 Tax=Neobacillus jeddahensis TaxID=1461580 RepID=UPI00058F33CF|nr:SGNH/GDSL hydrolase family protein [Neobacillus jeddahensis]
MKKLLFVLLLLFSATFLTIGQLHYDKKIEKMGLAAVASAKQDKQAEMQKEKENRRLLEENKFNSVIDWLKYQSSQKEQIVISTVGSSVTAGTGASDPTKSWSGLLESYLKNAREDLSAISFINNGYDGFTIQEFLKENKLNELQSANPDLIIVEPPVIDDYRDNTSLKQTKQDLALLISEIKKVLPDSMIMIQSANPTTIPMKSQWGNSYQDYIESMTTVAEENNVNMIDVTNGIQTLQEKNQKSVEDILSDESHPNDLGYQYWFETLKTSFENDKIVP